MDKLFFQLQKSPDQAIKNPKAYLCRILLNNLVDYKRKSEKEKVIEEDKFQHPWEGQDQYDVEWEQRFDQDGHWRKEFMSGPEKESFHKEIRQYLEQCIEALPLAQRHIFIMREIDLLDHQSIGAQFQQKPNSIRQQLKRAKNKLKDCLTGHLGSEENC